MHHAHSEREAVSSTAGDVFAQQRGFLVGTSWWNASAREVIGVSGPDRLVWLHSLLTQDLLALGPGVTTEALVLTPQGKVEHSVLITDDGVTAWLLPEAGHTAPLVAWLSSMVFRMEVSLSTPEMRVWGYWGLQESDFLLPDVVEFVDPWPRVGEGSVGYSNATHPGSGWALRYGAGSAFPLSASRHNRVSDEAIEALMIAAGRPCAADVDDKTLPHELDWLRTAVHLNKGCYRGQESVAKVHNLGHPPRRLTLLHVDGSLSLLPTPGDTVMKDDAALGVVTRAGWHHELGPVALALLKRMAPEGEVTIATSDGVVAANQELLVPRDAGRAMPRRRLG